MAGATKTAGDQRHRVVIVGGGFGGLRAALALAKAPAAVTLVDRRNFHLFQPLLYQVATGSLSPANIASPLRALLRYQRNAEVLMAEVAGFDIAARRLLLTDGELPYDTLVLAPGSGFNYFGHDDWSRVAPGLKTVEDATSIRRRVFTAFEQAERATDREDRAAWLTFVIIGGGATGVELAGALADVARHTLKRDFRAIDPRTARILLVEGQHKVLGSFRDPLPERAAATLAQLGVEVEIDSRVTDVRPDGVTLTTSAGQKNVRSFTTIWTAGVKASPLAALLARATGATADSSGRIPVEPDLTLPEHREIFVIGDAAQFSHQDGKPLPGLAPVAMQQGHYVAEVIRRRLRSAAPPAPFRYFDKGTLAVIGRNAAVVDIWGIRFSGYFAWLLWLFIHLLYLVQFQNRILVLVQWSWSYFTRNRAACLITGLPPDFGAPEQPGSAAAVRELAAALSKVAAAGPTPGEQ
jgi:NADH:ubiquinone reductase (H+-translocating)